MALGDNLTLGNEKLMRRTGKGPVRKSDGEEAGLATHRDYLLEEEAYTHQQLQKLLEALEAFRNGDTSVRLSKEREDIHADIAESYNAMVAMIGGVVNDVSKVSRQVGTQGKLGGQAEVPGVAGIWKDLTDNVNMLANNLTEQVRNIAEVTTAVANGDLTRSITVEVQGEMADLKKTMNQMVVNLNAFASEVTRVAREVGTEGKLGGQANVPGVAGIWKDLTDNVNFMAGNLTTQVRGIVNVVTAVAKGDLTQRLVVEAKGEIAALADTINNMTDTLGTFADQVTNVARTVGVEGRLGAQAEVPGAAGTWKDLTDNVNLLAGNLTSQVRNIAEVSTAVANGDLTKSITVEALGEIADLKETINQMVINLNGFASEVTRVAREVGTEGKLGGQAEVPGVAGIWKELTDNVNLMAGNLTAQVRSIAEVATAVAFGDLTRSITVDAKGEIAQLKDTINQMVVNLNAFSSEVTRVAREVGTEGKLGGQANVPGVAGIWKDLTDNVNAMAGNLTTQVRGIVKVVTAVANGDLTQKLVLEAKGEIAALADTINSMVDDLNRLADEISRVAKVAGEEGKLTERAVVEGVGGSWQQVVDTLNRLIESIAVPVLEVSRIVTAISEGDLTQNVRVQTAGDIKEMSDNLDASLENLNAFISQIKEAADTVAAASQAVAVSGVEMNQTTSQVAKAIQQIAQGASDQAQKTVAASGSVEQISRAAEETAHKGNEVNLAAQAGSQSAKQGVETVGEAVDSMNRIAEAAERTSSTLEALILSTERISKALQVITDIASQTNLLALNAAIEAARAGEAGRGFAVVAENVRELAMGSRKSADEISELVSNMQKESATASEAVRTMLKNVASGGDATNKSSDAFREILNTIDQTVAAAVAISQAAEQQKEGITDVVKIVDEISSIAQQTSSGAQQTTGSAQRLTSAMQELTASGQDLAEIASNVQERVAAFKLKSNPDPRGWSRA